MNVFRTFKDSSGRKYVNCYANAETEATITVNGRVLVLKGTPKIVLRRGSSVYGEQFLFQFLVKEVKQEYDAKTEHETVEFYLPAEEGLSFLKESVQYLEDESEK